MEREIYSGKGSESGYLSSFTLAVENIGSEFKNYSRHDSKKEASGSSRKITWTLGDLTLAYHYEYQGAEIDCRLVVEGKGNAGLEKRIVAEMKKISRPELVAVSEEDIAWRALADGLTKSMTASA